MASENSHLKIPLRLFAYALFGGMFTGSMAYFVQGRAFGFENVPIVAVVLAFLVGASAAVIIAYLVFRSNRALRDREQRLSALVESAADGIITIDSNGTIESFSPAAERIFGYEADAVIGKNVSMLMPAAEGARHDGYIRHYLDTGEGRIIGMGPREVTARRRNGGTFPMSLTVGAMRADGETKFVGIVRDISQEKENTRLFQQGQKMDAIGQLSGGIAHDFNNLLTVIIGNLELVQRGSGDEKVRRQIDAALRAAFRGADLTKRLLAFSQKETLDPEISDVNFLVADAVKLLGRTLGENIEIKAELTDEAWPIRVDRNLLESAIVNLALNARDAMPGGGRLIVETANATLDEAYASTRDEVVPGDYVCISVSDTGCGMSAWVREHAFEPFFTTKEVGQGAGLGLSMVFGFAIQSGGHAAIYSEEGLGTTVKLYFPRVEESTKRDEAAAVTAGTDPAILGHGETVLLVEDQEEVRDFAAECLKELGYMVLEAGDGPSAVALAEDAGSIDILVSDVVMPGGMNGGEVAEALSKLHPNAKVLFMSGYPRNVIAHHDQLEQGVELLGKPFTREALAAAVRRILDEAVL